MRLRCRVSVYPQVPNLNHGRKRDGNRWRGLQSYPGVPYLSDESDSRPLRGTSTKTTSTRSFHPTVLPRKILGTILGGSLNGLDRIKIRLPSPYSFLSNRPFYYEKIKEKRRGEEKTFRATKLPSRLSGQTESLVQTPLLFLQFLSPPCIPGVLGSGRLLK